MVTTTGAGGGLSKTNAVARAPLETSEEQKIQQSQLFYHLGNKGFFVKALLLAYTIQQYLKNATNNF